MLELGYDEALDSPQVAAREMIVEMTHPTTGQVRNLGQPAKFSRPATPASQPT
jgi:formyl-CoA transferase